MGSTLLYGTLFCLILWWLIRYYLLPWWRQEKQAGYLVQPKQAPEDADSKTTLSERTDADTSPNPALELPDPTNGNYSQLQTARQAGPPVAETPEPSTEADPDADPDADADADADDLNATTDLQGQLQILHKEQERLKGRSIRPNAQVRAGRNRAQDHLQAAQKILDAPVRTREHSTDNTEQALHEHIATLEKQVDENNRDITMLCSQLKEARLYETRFHENDKRMAEQQIQLLEKDDELREEVKRANELEAHLAEKNRNITQLKSDIASGVARESALSTQVQRMTALETDLREKNQAIHQLTLKADKVTGLEKNAHENDETIARLTSETARLEATLQEKDHQIERLSQAHEQFESQENTEQQLARLLQAESELQESQQRIQTLSTALAKAEEDSNASQQNDLELRRLRSELHTVTQLEADIRQRDQRITELQSRLDNLLSTPREPAGTHTETHVRTHGESSRAASSTLHRATENLPVQPLFSAPAERDDLKKIKGIGPVMEKTLYSLGVTSFRQLSEFTQTDIDTVSAAIQAFPGRIERDNWIGGAREQYLKNYGSKTEA